MGMNKRLLFMAIPGGLTALLLIITIVLSLETNTGADDTRVVLATPVELVPQQKGSQENGVSEKASQPKNTSQKHSPKIIQPKPTEPASQAADVPMSPVLVGSKVAAPKNSSEALLEEVYQDRYSLFRGSVCFFTDKDQSRPTPKRVMRPIFYKRDLSQRLMDSLFAGPSLRNLEQGIYSFIPAGLSYKVERKASTLVIDLVDLKPELLVGPLGGYVVYQILDTAFSHPDIRWVDLKVGGVSIRYPTPDGGERRSPFDISILDAFQF